MPLTDFQASIALLLAKNRTEDSHLAGGAALHIEPQSLRFSQDLDYFHDSDRRVAEAFAADENLLREAKFALQIEIRQPGYIRARVSNSKEVTKIEWSYDTAWRFMPAQKDTRCGYLLHPIDLAINKVLALVGRTEARDLLDVIDADKRLLSLGALCWAAAGKDPGLNPVSILELLKRRGRVRPEDLHRLHLNRKIELSDIVAQWRAALDAAEVFVSQRPLEELGCLYLHLKQKTFYSPLLEERRDKDYAVHWGQPGGLMPLFRD